MKNYNELKDVLRIGAKSNFWLFCCYYDFEFFVEKRHFLKEVALLFQFVIDEYKEGKAITVSVSMPPRSGKSYITSLFCAFWLGTFPKLSVMRNSCTATLFDKFSYDVRNILKSDKFQNVFDARLQIDKQNISGWNLTESVQVGYFGAGVGGTIVGFGANLAITDDLYKDISSALSSTNNNAVKMWKESAHDSRMEKNCPEIFIGTRWTIDDIIGSAIESKRIQKSIIVPALIDECSFCEDVKTTEEYLVIRDRVDKNIWFAEYMQNPKSIEGLLFHEELLSFYEEATNFEYVFIEIDPADKGKDKLCSVVFGVKEKVVYVLNVIYTEDETKITIPLVLEQIKQYKPSDVRIETNAAWIMYAEKLREKINEIGSSSSVRIYNESKNKELRIYNEAPFIRNCFKFKLNPVKEYQNAMHDLTNYMKLVVNQKDDFVDVLAAASVILKKNRMIETF